MKTLNIEKEKASLCANIIIDGNIMEDALKDMHRDKSWLNHELKIKGIYLNKGIKESKVK